MSAEKEIVNFWFNKQGYFTINNLKSKGNRDLGLLALKFDNKEVVETKHVDVNCSIIGNIGETTNLDRTVKKIVKEKFTNTIVKDAISKHLDHCPSSKEEVKRIIVLGALPKSRKKEVMKTFKENKVGVIEFDQVLSEVMRDLDTKYYKNNTIRTLQLIKYLLFTDPKKVSKVMMNGVMSSHVKEELLHAMLQNKEFMRGFRSTDEYMLATIIRNSKLKDPEKLAHILHQEILNNKTRKPFFDTLMSVKPVRKFMVKKKKEIPLKRFF